MGLKFLGTDDERGMRRSSPGPGGGGSSCCTISICWPPTAPSSIVAASGSFSSSSGFSIQSLTAANRGRTCFSRNRSVLPTIVWSSIFGNQSGRFVSSPESESDSKTTLGAPSTAYLRPGWKGGVSGGGGGARLGNP